MWDNPATQSNIRALRARQVMLLGPAEGDQACGDSGSGRMLEAVAIVHEVAGIFETGSLAGANVLITAGPTREALDPVRFLSNRSSGRMGYALAQAAVEAGARVTLVSGPVQLPVPDRLHAFIAVETAQEMHQAVMSVIQDSHIMLATAAVADYRPARAGAEKQKRQAGQRQLTLVPTPDVLAEAMAANVNLFSVAFAAETHEVERHARDKLQRKGVDMLVANRVGRDSNGQTVGFESEDNQVTVLWRDGSREFPLMSKTALAREIIKLIAGKYNAQKHSTEDSGRSAG
jgi:phosphopantothenoylcysteine decarboxylase/phosphopantothenate--cysteine ligase